MARIERYNADLRVFAQIAFNGRLLVPTVPAPHADCHRAGRLPGFRYDVEL